MSDLNLLDMLDDLGPDVVKAVKPARPPQLAAHEVAKAAKVAPHMVPCVIFHPDALTVKDVLVDIANSENAGRWYPTSHGTMVSNRFLAHPEMKEALLTCIEEIEIIRVNAIKAESKALGKMFALAEASRPELLATPAPKKQPEINPLDEL